LNKFRHHFTRPLVRLGRYRHIMAVLAKYGFGETISALNSRLLIRFTARVAQPRIAKPARSTRPARVRLAMEELGPTFIKLVQLLSTRPDLIPAEYVKELEHLQDSVAPVDFKKIRREIELELGGSLEDFFETFDPVPIAAASIAQVHKATTKDGKSVVVKVRRPGIVRSIQSDCLILEDLARILKATIFKNEPIDPVRMVAEFTETITKEVDFNNERRNQIRFGHFFSGDPAIHVPLVYEQLCSEGILTMEYIDGIKPHDRQVLIDAGLDPKLIADRGADFILKQIFDLGFFHSDPHPGNFFLLPANILVPIDFGQVVWLPREDRYLITSVVMALVDNDIEAMVQAFERADMINEKTDVVRLARETEQMLAGYYNMPLKEIPFGRLILQTFDIMRKNYVQPPPQFALMLKSIMTIESFALNLDPQFDILEHLKPYAAKFTNLVDSPLEMLKNAKKAFRGARDLASRLPQDVNSILDKLLKGKYLIKLNLEHLEHLVKILDKSSDRISAALISAALLVSSSLLVSQEGKVFGQFSLQTLGVIGYFVAAIIGIWLVISIIRGKYL
jgi:ubiquinone biosynthesis protein